MREIPLTQNQVALIDDKDYDLVSRYTWHALRKRYTFYAVTSVPHPDGIGHYRPNRKRELRQKPLGMHTLITGFTVTDHISGDGLDNRRCNLRIATISQNNANSRMHSNNSSGFKGVSWNKRLNRWNAYISHNRQQIYLGLFDDPILAAFAYDDAAREYFGEYARPNFAFGPDSLIPEQFTSDDPCPGGQEVTT